MARLYHQSCAGVTSRMLIVFPLQGRVFLHTRNGPYDI